jgi:hypothetical protein
MAFSGITMTSKDAGTNEILDVLGPRIHFLTVLSGLPRERGTNGHFS